MSVAYSDGKVLTSISGSLIGIFSMDIRILS